MFSLLPVQLGGVTEQLDGCVLRFCGSQCASVERQVLCVRFRRRSLVRPSSWSSCAHGVGCGAGPTPRLVRSCSEVSWSLRGGLCVRAGGFRPLFRATHVRESVIADIVPWFFWIADAGFPIRTASQQKTKPRWHWKRSKSGIYARTAERSSSCKVAADCMEEAMKESIVQAEARGLYDVTTNARALWHDARGAFVPRTLRKAR